jgi:hypothetical protein
MIGQQALCRVIRAPKLCAAGLTKNLKRFLQIIKDSATWQL